MINSYSLIIYPSISYQGREFSFAITGLLDARKGMPSSILINQVLNFKVQGVFFTYINFSLKNEKAASENKKSPFFLFPWQKISHLNKNHILTSMIRQAYLRDLFINLKFFNPSLENLKNSLEDLRKAASNHPLEQLLHSLVTDSTIVLKNFQKIGILIGLKQLQKSDTRAALYLKTIYEKCNQYFHCDKKQFGFSLDRTYAYKSWLTQMRQQAAKEIHSDGFDMKKICQSVSESFLGLMQTIIQDALTDIYQVSQNMIFKDAASKYAFIALGSLARQEQTPYSDLEFAILTDKELSNEEKQDLAQLSDWIHHQILLLEETPLIELGVQTLTDRDTLKKGVSLDGHLGGKAPSWDLRLINTPLKLACLQKDEILQEEMFFLRSIQNVRTIYGNSLLTTLYQDNVQNILNDQTQEERALKILSIDSDRFSILRRKKESTGFVVSPKYEFYRAIQLRLESLAIYFGIDASNIFDQIDQLRCKNIFNDNTSLMLKDAANSILKLRYQHYLKEGFASEEMPLAETAPWIEIYQAVLSFEYYVKKFIFEKKESRSLTFKDFERIPKPLAVSLLEKEADQGALALHQQMDDADTGLDLKINLYLHCIDAQIMDKNYHAAERILHHVEQLLHFHEGDIHSCMKAAFYGKRAICKCSQRLYDEALQDIQTAETILEESGIDPFLYSHIYCTLLLYEGKVYYAMKEFNKGLEKLERSVALQEKLHMTHFRYALTLYYLGKIYYHMEHLQIHDISMRYFKDSLRIFEKISGKENVFYCKALQKVNQLPPIEHGKSSGEVSLTPME